LDDGTVSSPGSQIDLRFDERHDLTSLTVAVPASGEVILSAESVELLPVAQ
jgi:hypothetical protein